VRDYLRIGLISMAGLILAAAVPTAGATHQSCLVTQLQPGHVQRVIDGDTFILYHVGVPAEERVRVLGLDAWELSDPRGAAAKAFTTEWLARAPFRLGSCKRDSFGRLLAIVTRNTDTLAVDLINAGHGVRR
jgi:endonuclease YncB( thermonuclease family)